MMLEKVKNGVLFDRDLRRWIEDWETKMDEVNSDECWQKGLNENESVSVYAMIHVTKWKMKNLMMKWDKCNTQQR